MKKLLTLLIVGLMAFSLTACKGDDSKLVRGSGENFDDNMVIEYRLTRHENRSLKPVEIFEKMAESPLITFDYEIKEVNEGTLYGFKEAVEGFKRGAMLASKDVEVPVLMYIFELSDLSSSKKFTDQLIKKIEPKFNGEKEVEVVSTYAVENNIFIVMSPNTVK